MGEVLGLGVAAALLLFVGKAAPELAGALAQAVTIIAWTLSASIGLRALTRSALSVLFWCRHHELPPRTPIRVMLRRQPTAALIETTHEPRMVVTPADYR